MEAFARNETLSNELSSSSDARQRRRLRVSLLHSESHTQLLYQAMRYIHGDRDILLAALLNYCGFLHKPPKFFTIVSPKRANRRHLEFFHASHYLNILECDEDRIDEENIRPLPSTELLDSMGLTDDCPVPSDPPARAVLWKYCRYVSGASLQAAHLLASDATDVAIHWGGGRHHAHSGHAGGFCFVNDVVLALQHLQQRSLKTLYIDIDIHHADGVQRAFYDTDQVLTVSLHRHARGFFPFPTGSSKERGLHRTDGVGYNLNLPLKPCCSDREFQILFRYALTSLADIYEPHAVVLCVGADGLRGDPLVGSTDLGWNLTPEGIAECVRIAAEHCGASNRKLLILGGGGYDAAATARTFLLCTAAACEGARPGMLWKELPKDMPRHIHFPRYGPDFRLLNRQQLPVEEAEKKTVLSSFPEARRDVDLTALSIRAKREAARVSFQPWPDDDEEAFVPEKALKKQIESVMEKRTISSLRSNRTSRRQRRGTRPKQSTLTS